MPAWALISGKIICGIAWAAVIVNLISPFPGGLHTIFLYGGLGLLVIHIAECVMYFNVIKQKGTALPLDIIQVVLFGVLHVMLLRQRKLA